MTTTRANSSEEAPVPGTDGTGSSRQKLLSNVEQHIDKYLESGKLLLGVVGVFIYGIVRAAYESFYGRLNLSPEDVGHSYTDILGRAVFGLVGFFAIFLILLCFGIYGLAWVDSRKGRSHSLGENAILVSLVILCVAPNVVSARSGDFLASWIVVVMLCALPVLTLLWLVATKRGSRLPLISLAIVTAMAMLVVGLTYRWGQYEAQQIIERHDITPEPLLGIFAIRAGLVCVAWTSTPHPNFPELQQKLTFLGEGHGFVHLVWSDGTSHRLLRIPASSVVLSTASSASDENCSATEISAS